MNKESFKQKMAALEQERDKFISKLSPEGQQEYKRKEEEFNLRNGINDAGFTSGNQILPNR